MGESLANAQHELIALAVLEGKTLRQIADAANYHTKWRESHVCNLIKRPEVQARIQELQQQTADDKVMSVIQRKIRLSELARNPIIGVCPVRCIHELNLMERIYKEGIDINLDQRVINVQVVSEASERATRMIIEGLNTLSEADKIDTPGESEETQEPSNSLLLSESLEEPSTSLLEPSNSLREQHDHVVNK